MTKRGREGEGSTATTTITQQNANSAIAIEGKAILDRRLRFRKVSETKAKEKSQGRNVIIVRS